MAHNSAIEMKKKPLKQMEKDTLSMTFRLDNTSQKKGVLNILTSVSPSRKGTALAFKRM